MNEISEATIASPTNTKAWIGLAVSLAYVAIVATIILLGITIDDLTLNEFGDFLAGAFAPLAFGWLVLGFFQQGDELRNSTNALRLQADELRASVEQQRKLVQITREQLDYERERASAAEAENHRISQPKFQIKFGGSSGDSNGDVKSRLTTLLLVNAGTICTDLKVTRNGKTSKHPVLATGEEIRIVVRHLAAITEPIGLTIDFTNARGIDGHKEFSLLPVNGRLTAMEAAQ